MVSRAHRGLGVDPLADLRRRLALALDRRTRVASIPRIRACVRAWWRDHDLGAAPALVGRRLALHLLAQRQLDAQLAGMIVVQVHLREPLRADDVDALAALVAGAHLRTPGQIELLARLVLVPLLVRAPHRRDAVRAIAAWREHALPALRRAACLALAGLLARPGAEHLAADLRDDPRALVEPALAVCATVAWSPEPLEQAAVGSLLRALAGVAPARVEAFVRPRGHLLARPAVRRAVADLPPALRAELLAHHRRATTPRAARR